MKKKISFTLVMILIYVFIKQIPLVGVVSRTAQTNLSLNADNFANVVIHDSSGQALFLLGFGPWMIAFMLMAVFTVIRSRSKRLYSQKQRDRTTMIITFFIALFQAIVRMVNMEFTINDTASMFYYLLRFTVLFEIVFAVFFIVWLAKQNEKYGIGSMAVFILVNTVDHMQEFIVSLFTKFYTEGFFSFVMENRNAILYTLVVLLVIVALAKADSRIPLQRTLINNTLKEGSYLSVKVNPVGTMAMLYALAFFALPADLLHILDSFIPDNGILTALLHIWSLRTLCGMIAFLAMYIFFAIAMTLVHINPYNLAGNMEAAGDCIADVNPGEDTKRYLLNTIQSLGLLNGIVMCLLVGLPVLLGGGTESLVSLMTIVIFIGMAVVIFEAFRIDSMPDNIRKYHKRKRASLF